MLAIMPAPATEMDCPPTRKGKATRERLLVAAESVFGQRGYDATRIADIACEAGVSHGLFYRHFADRDAVLFAVLTRLNDNLRRTSGRGDAAAEMLPTLDQIQARNILFFTEYALNRKMLRVSREAAAGMSNTGFRSLWLEIRARFTARTLRWIRELADSGAIVPFDDPTMIAEALSSLTEQMAYVQIGLAAADPDEQLIERLGRASGIIWFRTIFAQPT